MYRPRVKPTKGKILIAIRRLDIAKLGISINTIQKRIYINNWLKKPNMWENFWDLVQYLEDHNLRP
jgi:hypothetical protein